MRWHMLRMCRCGSHRCVFSGSGQCYLSKVRIIVLMNDVMNECPDDLDCPAEHLVFSISPAFFWLVYVLSVGSAVVFKASAIKNSCFLIIRIFSVNISHCFFIILALAFYDQRSSSLYKKLQSH